MKYLLLISILLSSVMATAQLNSGYVAFSLADTINQPVHTEEYKIQVLALNTNNLEELSLPIQFDAASGLYYFNLSADLFTSNMHIQVTNVSTGASSIIKLYLQPKFKTSEQFKNLLVLKIPVFKNNLVIDLPAEEVSWQFVPETIKKINGQDITLRDITFMQNWLNQ